jgi:DNA gyrase subunit B
LHDVTVTIHADQSVTVSDDGRGIPVDIHPEEGVSAAEVIITVLHAGGKFDDSSYKVSGGLHGVGVSVVNALSETWTSPSTATARNTQEYRLGEPVSPAGGDGPSDKRGTTLRFKPSDTIFTNIEFDYEILQKRLRELSFLNSGVRIELHDERDDRSDSFEYEGGIREFVKLPESQQDCTFTNRFLVSRRARRHRVELALQWNDSYAGDDVLLHQQHPAEGRRHAPRRLPRRADAHAQRLHREREANKKDKVPTTGDDAREGLTAVLSVKLPTRSSRRKPRTSWSRPR